MNDLSPTERVSPVASEGLTFFGIRAPAVAARQCSRTVPNGTRSERPKNSRDKQDSRRILPQATEPPQEDGPCP